LTCHKNTLEVANDFNQFFQSVGKRAAETAKMLALQNNLNISTELEPQKGDLNSTQRNCSSSLPSHAQRCNV
jgi:hypothetical protein